MAVYMGLFDSLFRRTPTKAFNRSLFSYVLGTSAPDMTGPERMAGSSPESSVDVLHARILRQPAA